MAIDSNKIRSLEMINKLCSSVVVVTLGIKGMLLGGRGTTAEIFLVNMSGVDSFILMMLINSKGLGFHFSILISLLAQKSL